MKKKINFGYPRIIHGREAIPVPVPAKPRVGHGYYPRIKFRIHARTHRVGYPRIPVPTDKIAIPNLNLDLLIRYSINSNLTERTSFIFFGTIVLSC